MPTQPSISAKETKDGLVINECTGKYNGENKGGWGIPNTTLSSVTSAQFEIYTPQATTPIIISVYPDFPTDDKDLGYEVLLTQLGVSYIESGTWKIGYRVIGVDSLGVGYEYYTESKFIFIDNAKCCVDKLRAHTVNVPVNVFMKDEKKRAATELSLLLRDAEYAAKCFNYNAADRILKFINLQCKCC